MVRRVKYICCIRRDWNEALNCWHCETQLIWGGDHDCEDEEEFAMVTNLSCPTCDSLVLVYYPTQEEDEDVPAYE